MPRIKIASIKTSNNQKRIVKTAQRAINISSAFDEQGSYKNSSEFFELACRYARFITAQEEPTEEKKPTSEEVDWQRVHNQNVTPELEEAYNLYPTRYKMDFTNPRPILTQPKYGDSYTDIHFQNANALTRSFYDQLVKNNGNVLQSLNEITDLIKSFKDTFSSNGNLVSNFFAESLGLALAAYYKDNSFLSISNQTTSYAQMYATNVYMGVDNSESINRQLRGPVQVDNQTERHSKLLAYLKDLFKEELAQNPQKIMPMISHIMDRPGYFMTGGEDEQKLRVDKDDFLAVYFADDDKTKDDGYSEGISLQEILHRLEFIKDYGRENYDNYLANENNQVEFSSDRHIKEKARPYEQNPSPEALKNVMSFLVKYENIIRLGINSGHIYYEKLNRILKQFGQEFVAQFFSGKEKNYDLDYITNVTYSLILQGKSAEEITETLVQNERNLGNLAYSLQMTDLSYEYLEQRPEQLQLFMDYVNKGLIDNQVFKNFPDAKKIIDNCLKSYLDWLVKNSRGDVENTRTLALGYSTLFYHAHREFGEDVMLMRPGQMSKIVQNDAYDRTRFEQIINGKYILTPEQEQAKEDEINKWIDDNYSSYISDSFRDKRDDPRKEKSLRWIAQNAVVMFGNNPSAKYLAAEMKTPSVIDEENRKIGEDFLNLRTKGIYSFRNFTHSFKFIPPEIKSKYDTHELGILVSLFDSEYLSENNNKAIQRFENAVQTIARKNPELYQKKGEKYYSLLKHFYMSPGTRIDNLDGLFGLLELTRSSVRDKDADERFQDYEMFSPRNLSIFANFLQSNCKSCGGNKNFDSQTQKWYCSKCNTSEQILTTDLSEILRNGRSNMRLRIINDLKESRDIYSSYIQSFNTLTNSKFNNSSTIDDIISRGFFFMVPYQNGEPVGTEEEIKTDNEVRTLISRIQAEFNKFVKTNVNMKAFYRATNDSEIQNAIENILREYLSEIGVESNVDFGELDLHDIKEAYKLNTSQHDVSFSNRKDGGILDENHIRSNMYENFWVKIEESYKNLDLLVLVFGNEIWKWLDKFTTQAHFNPNRTKDDPENITKFSELTDVEKNKIIHDSSQPIPSSATTSKNKGIGRYLLQFYRDALSQDLKFIVTNWNKKVKIDNETSSTEYVVAEAAYMEPFKSNPNSLVNILRYQNLIKFFGDKPPKSMDFAYEVAKWYTVDDDDEEDAIEEDYDEDKPDIEELTDEKYRRLEEMYLLSQQNPLPKWAQISPVKAGKYIGRFLPREDARAMFLGQYTRCCQHPENAAYGAAFDAILSPKACTFVIEDVTKKVHLQSYVWEDRNGNVCFDSFETGSRDFFYSEQRKQMASQIIQQLTSQMGNIKITGGNGLKNIMQNAPSTGALKNIGEGRAIAYKAFNGVFPVYSADSDRQYLISDNRNSKDSARQDAQQYPDVNSHEVLKQLTGNKLSQPNMTRNNWEEDLSNYVEGGNYRYNDDDDDDDD